MINKHSRIYDNLFGKINNAVIEIIKNRGIKNITCLISSYKFTLKSISNKIINKEEINNGAIVKIFLVEENIFFSLYIK